MHKLATDAASKNINLSIAIQLLHTFTILVKLSSIFKQSVLQLSVLAAMRPWTASSLADRGRNEGRGASGGSGGGTLDGGASVFSAVCHANGRQAFDNVEDRCMSDISSSSLKQPRVASRLHQLAVAARGVAWRWCEGRRGAQRGPDLLDGPVAARTAT